MKKFFMVAVMALTAAAANAQVWVGGSLNFNTSSTKVESLEVNSGTNFEIAPEVGYNLNDKWAVALALGYAHSENATLSLGEETLNGTSNSFSIKPYVRYTFVKSGNFSVFCDGYLEYETVHYQGMDNNINAFSIGLTPGISYDLSSKVSLVAHVGQLSYGHAWCDLGNATVKHNQFDLNITNAISFGAYVNL